mmetsp:Transcript_3259/g.8310  ORF Transcript_3259/g.8310 Transcript_3259/m.8310 type:complete len:147 (-) Transcript_3259:94-534(-)
MDGGDPPYDGCRADYRCEEGDGHGEYSQDDCEGNAEGGWQWNIREVRCHRQQQQQRTDEVLPGINGEIRLLELTVSHEEVSHGESLYEAAILDDPLGDGEVLHERRTPAAGDVDEEEMAGEGDLGGGRGFDEPRHLLLLRSLSLLL